MQSRFSTKVSDQLCITSLELIRFGPDYAVIFLRPGSFMVLTERLLQWP